MWGILAKAIAVNVMMGTAWQGVKSWWSGDTKTPTTAVGVSGSNIKPNDVFGTTSPVRTYVTTGTNWAATAQQALWLIAAVLAFKVLKPALKAIWK